MRYLMLPLLTLSWLGLLAGCHTCSSDCSGGGHGGGRSCAHGVCDCELDDHCCSRSPWVKVAPATLGVPVEAVPVAPVPAKELPRSLPSKL